MDTHYLRIDCVGFMSRNCLQTARVSALIRLDQSLATILSRRLLISFNPSIRALIGPAHSDWTSLVSDSYLSHPLTHLYHDTLARQAFILESSSRQGEWYSQDVIHYHDHHAGVFFHDHDSCPHCDFRISLIDVARLHGCAFLTNLQYHSADWTIFNRYIRACLVHSGHVVCCTRHAYVVDARDDDGLVRHDIVPGCDVGSDSQLH